MERKLKNPRKLGRVTKHDVIHIRSNSMVVG